MNMEKAVVVTGASSGIGKAIALRLAKEKFYTVIHYNSQRDKAEAVLEEVKKNGGEGTIIQFNVQSATDVEAAMDVLFEDQLKERQLFGLVNNAGIHNDNLAALMSEEEFDNVIKTNLYGAFHVTQKTMRRMMRHKEGSIVNISSLAGQTGNMGQLNYSASKAGLIAMTKTLSQEMARKNIRVNAVAPGLIATEMISDIPGIDEVVKRVPMRRVGTPEEVAGAVAFLVGKDSTYITGHTISVNGGIYPS